MLERNVYSRGGLLWFGFTAGYIRPGIISFLVPVMKSLLPELDRPGLSESKVYVFRTTVHKKLASRGAPNGGARLSKR